MPSVAAMPDDFKPTRALLIQHPSAPVTLESVASAYETQQAERARVLASILAGFDDVTLGLAPRAVQAHYLEVARAAIAAAQKGLAL